MFVVPLLTVLDTVANVHHIARLPSPILASVSDVVVYGLVFLGVFAVVALIAFFVWLRTLFGGTLSNIASIELDESNPAVQEVQRLELQYAIAEDLDYPGEILVHLEAQLNAAKIAASGNPDATMTYFVTPFADLAVVQAPYFVLSPVPELARAYLEPLYTSISAPVFPSTPKPAAAHG